MTDAELLAYATLMGVHVTREGGLICRDRIFVVSPIDAQGKLCEEWLGLWVFFGVSPTRRLRIGPPCSYERLRIWESQGFLLPPQSN